MELSIRRHFWHPQLRTEIRNQVLKCTICDTMKKASLKEGQLAPRNVPMIPWSEVHVDEIRPWEYKVNGLTVKV